MLVLMIIARIFTELYFQGNTGDIGEQGESGPPAGFEGNPKGSNVLKGPKGNNGIQGEDGDQGNTGLPGLSGNDVCDIRLIHLM